MEERKSSELPKLKVKKMEKSAKLPNKGSANAAGYDLHALLDSNVPANGKALIQTGLAIAVPVGNYGRLAPPSGHSEKHMIDVGAGVIDADYRDEVQVLLLNLGKTDFKIAAGDIIAQLIIEKCTPTELKVMDSLDDSHRKVGQPI